MIKIDPATTTSELAQRNRTSTDIPAMCRNGRRDINMRLLDTKAVAPYVGVKPGTLENWRVQGVGPKFIKTAGRRGKVLYDLADIEAWKDANRYQSTSETA